MIYSPPSLTHSHLIIGLTLECDNPNSSFTDNTCRDVCSNRTRYWVTNVLAQNWSHAICKTNGKDNAPIQKENELLRGEIATLPELDLVSKNLISLLMAQ